MRLLKANAVESAIQRNVTSQTEKDALLSAVDSAETQLPDTWVYRLVVIALGLAIFVPLVAVRTPDTLQLLLPIATTALGALAGLLAPSPIQGG
jgi:hypothetical protein